MDLDEFVTANAPREGRDSFELENSKLLDIDVDGSVLVKAGSMVAFEGDLSFTGKSSAEGVSRASSNRPPAARGPRDDRRGHRHGVRRRSGKRIQVLTLDEGESVSVNGNDVLAFEDRVSYEIGTVGSLAGASAAGLTNVYLSGPGTVAITTHGDPLVLTPPVKTDPQATVAWSGDLSPGIETNRSLGDMVGQSSDERYQMSFDGDEGFVVIQPYEEGPADR
ncbi:AIM24 family protein [Halobaculum litoreum]|uniref:AIM24 family protein n=1 Tax=Halobaculum litoreum TaxID=3031998 RepID=A0ABD5XRZ8_9EURY